MNERKAYFSLRLILAAVRQRHRTEIAPLAISVRRSKRDRDRVLACFNPQWPNLNFGVANSQYLGAALLAIAVGIAVGFSSINAGDEYCPSPSPASVTSLFAPCQTFVAAVGHPVSKQEAVQMGLLMPDLRAAPAVPWPSEALMKSFGRWTLAPIQSL